MWTGTKPPRQGPQSPLLVLRRKLFRVTRSGAGGETPASRPLSGDGRSAYNRCYCFLSYSFSFFFFLFAFFFNPRETWIYFLKAFKQNRSTESRKWKSALTISPPASLLCKGNNCQMWHLPFWVHLHRNVSLYKYTGFCFFFLINGIMFSYCSAVRFLPLAMYLWDLAKLVNIHLS